MSDSSNTTRDRRRWLAQRLSLLLSAGMNADDACKALNINTREVAGEDALFVQKLAVWAARTYPRSLAGELVIALVDHMGVADAGDIRRATRILLQQPDALGKLSQLLEYATLDEHPLGNGIRRGVRDALEAAPPRVIAAHSSSTTPITMRDALRLCHPRAASPEAAQAFAEICGERHALMRSDFRFDAQSCEAAAATGEFTAFDCLIALTHAVREGARVKPYLDALQNRSLVGASRMPASFVASAYYQMENRCGIPVREAIDAAIRTLMQNDPHLPGLTLILMDSDPGIWSHADSISSRESAIGLPRKQMSLKALHARMAAFTAASIARASEEALIAIPCGGKTVTLEFTPTESPLDDVERILLEGRRAQADRWRAEADHDIAATLDAFRAELRDANRASLESPDELDDGRLARVVRITSEKLTVNAASNDGSMSLDLRENPPYVPVAQCFSNEIPAGTPVPYWLHVIQTNAYANRDAERVVVQPQLRRTVIEKGLPEYAAEFIAAAEHSTDETAWDDVAREIDCIFR